MFLFFISKRRCANLQRVKVNEYVNIADLSTVTYNWLTTMQLSQRHVVNHIQQSRLLETNQINTAEIDK